MRHKVLSGVIAVVVIIIIAAAASSGGGDSNSNNNAGSHDQAAKTKDKSKDKSSSAPSTQASASDNSSSNTYGTAKMPIQNGDWRLDSVQLKNDGLGDFGGTARVTYTGDDPSGGDNLFTITVFKGKKIVTTLDGAANSVKPGSTATVTLISTDNYVPGPYKYDFQNNL